jgi:transketolase
MGDGEMQEGSNWEALMSGAHYRLDNLTAIVDRNRLQQGARTEATNALDPLAEKWRAFGWEAVEVDGHDHAALLAVLGAAPGEKPRCVIADTLKGKGVSFMEDRVEWHHKVPSAEQLAAALRELGA